MDIKLNSIDRNKFIIKISHIFLSLLALINFPFANYMKTKIMGKPNTLRISKLPDNGPWPTVDPFLFCVHHNDNYPRANSKLGPDSSLDNRNIGDDFSNLNGWSMYHCEKIPGFPRLDLV